jgi:thymidine phosphorylase
MNEVLGTTAGNAVEIAESVRFLRNEQRERRLDEVVIALSAEMLVAGGIESDRGAAKRRCGDAVESGRAAEVFGRMVAALGGPTDFVENYDRYLPRAPVIRRVQAEGIVSAVDTLEVGNAIIELGGGRRRVGDQLDLSVGLTEVAAIGTRLDRERPLAIIHAATETDAAVAEEHLRSAYTLSDEAPGENPVIYGILEG